MDTSQHDNPCPLGHDAQPSRPGSRAHRRSSRIPFASRIVVSGKDNRGVSFRLDGEILEISLHGARIRTKKDLSVGMKLRIFSPAKKRSCDATVVWSRTPDGTDAGVQLDAANNFWGLKFPSDHRQQSHKADDRASEAVGERRPRTEEGLTAKPCDSPAQSELLQIPSEGTEVTVTGISMCHVPFQERTLFLPDECTQSGAVLWLKPMLKIGAHLRVVFADGRTTTVRVVSSLDNAAGERRTVCVALRDGLRLFRQPVV